MRSVNLAALADRRILKFSSRHLARRKTVLFEGKIICMD